MRSKRGKSFPSRYGRRWGQGGHCRHMRYGEKDPEQADERNSYQITGIRIYQGYSL